MVILLNCDIGVSEFELQSRYYVHFWTNVLAKDMNLQIPPIKGKIVTVLSFDKDSFDNNQPTEVVMPLNKTKNSKLLKR